MAISNPGFWLEYRKYEAISDNAADLFIKSIKYSPRSKQRKIFRLMGEVKRESALPVLNRLVNYLENQETEITERETEMLKLIKRLVQLNHRDELST